MIISHYELCNISVSMFSKSVLSLSLSGINVLNFLIGTAIIIYYLLVFFLYSTQFNNKMHAFYFCIYIFYIIGNSLSVALLSATDCVFLHEHGSDFLKTFLKFFHFNFNLSTPLYHLDCMYIISGKKHSEVFVPCTKRRK